MSKHLILEETAHVEVVDAICRKASPSVRSDREKGVVDRSVGIVKLGVPAISIGRGEMSNM
eukprot:2225500-Rhodomonas_salina.3